MLPKKHELKRTEEKEQIGTFEKGPLKRRTARNDSWSRLH